MKRFYDFPLVSRTISRNLDDGFSRFARVFRLLCYSSDDLLMLLGNKIVEHFGIPRTKIYELIRDKEIVVAKLTSGGKERGITMVSPSSVDAYIRRWIVE